MKKIFRKEIKKEVHIKPNQFGWDQATYFSGNFVEDPRKQKNYYLPRQ